MILRHNFCDHKTKKYDGRNNVTELEIKIKNAARRKRDGSQNRDKNSDLDSLVFDLIDVHNIFAKYAGYNSFRLKVDILLDFARDKYNRIIAYHVKQYVEQYIEIFGKKKVLKILRPLFYVIYENNETGLLTLQEFEKKYMNRRGQSDLYEGYYDKYYFSRLNTLLNIKNLL
jgi:hypothetical protein